MTIAPPTEQCSIVSPRENRLRTTKVDNTGKPLAKDSHFLPPAFPTDRVEACTTAHTRTHTGTQCRTLKTRTEWAFFPSLSLSLLLPPTTPQPPPPPNSPWLRNGEDTVVLLFCSPVFVSSFIQSCKAAVWCHQSQSLATSCAPLIGCNDLRMSLRTLIRFSLRPICLPVLPRAAGCLPPTRRRAPPTLHSLQRCPYNPV